MHRRPLTEGEIRLSRTIFGDAIDYTRAGVRNRKWAFFQSRNTVMAPLGTIHFHPDGGLYRDDFATASLDLQALFLHEMTHVWQHQSGLFLPLSRHPFCRYRYRYDPVRRFTRYGIEQQAELVRHAFLARHGVCVPGAPPIEAWATLLPFDTQACR
ncbi:vgr related protein [Sphingomonas sp. HT-1]|uniref:hypothetical protein n=1 Tax=unclassified Sphingomonas TaxID=196159 RepID=UPI0002DB3559|nr:MULTISPECIES: hypothetical protein [unclassified Sphingomonas]KTF69575.1 vgr related protein [Sphingomonas sp. WG]